MNKKCTEYAQGSNLNYWHTPNDIQIAKTTHDELRSYEPFIEYNAIGYVSKENKYYSVFLY